MSTKIQFNISDKDFIKKYNELKSSRKVAEFYGCSKTTILRHCKEIGFDPKTAQVPKLTLEDKKRIISLYNEKTSTELAEEYNVSRGMITKLWYDANLNGKKNINNTTTEIDLTNQKIGKWTVLYKTNKRDAAGAIYWHCKCECGREKDVLGTSLRQHRSLSCGLHNNISKGNVKISELLDKAGIEYEIEKTFNTCKDKKELPFDFYVDNKYLIEYDGEQHFNKNTTFDYEYTHNHDIIKSKWCKENNIPLIRIPYTHYNSLALEDLLLKTSKYIEK